MQWMTDLFTWMHTRKARVFWVGGTVRDLLLQRVPPDWDVAVQVPDDVDLGGWIADWTTWTNTRPGHRCFAIRAAFPTYRWVLPTRRWVDIVFFQGTITAELARRDFTVNALALEWQREWLPRFSTWMHPEHASVHPDVAAFVGAHCIDPFAGRSDLEKRVLRAIHRDNLRADPVRIARAYRLSAQLHLTIDPRTRQWLRSTMADIRQAPPERVVTEVLKWFLADGADPRIVEADRDGFWTAWIPEVQPMKGCIQGGYHHLDVWDHSLETVRALTAVVDRFRNLEEFAPFMRALWQHPWTMQMPRWPFVKWTALFHDIGKPSVRRPARYPGAYVFYGHAQVGARLIAPIMTRLRFSRAAVRWVREMIGHHMVPLEMWKRQGVQATVRYLTRRFGPQAMWLILLSTADQMAKAGPLMEPHRNREFVDMCLGVMRVLRDPATSWQFPLRGSDLVHMGVPPGPQIGQILTRLRREWWQGQWHTREEGLQRARKWIRSMGY